LPIRFDSIRFDSIRFDSIRFDSIRFDSIRFDLWRRCRVLPDPPAGSALDQRFVLEKRMLFVGSIDALAFAPVRNRSVLPFGCSAPVRSRTDVL
jgi:hypothetical protein